MKTIFPMPTVKVSDSFDLCLHLTNLFGMFDIFSIHLYTDPYHVNILNCNFSELVSKLSSLDYSQYCYIFVYGRTMGLEKSDEYIQLFTILQRYRSSDCSESLIKFTYL